MATTAGGASQVDIVEHSCGHIFVLRDLTCESLELENVDAVQIIQMSDLHLKAHTVLLATQSPGAHLLVRHLLVLQRSHHVHEKLLRVSVSGAVHIERASQYLHAIVAPLSN